MCNKNLKSTQSQQTIRESLLFLEGGGGGVTVILNLIFRRVG